MVMLIKVPPDFRPHAAAAALRLGYLRPELTCVVADGGDLEVSAPSDLDEAGIKRDLLHLLYREKVYAETLDLRRALYEGCMR